MSEPGRWTIYVCDGCGNYGTSTEMDPWLQGLVHHGESDDPTACVRPAREVVVVAAIIDEQTERCETCGGLLVEEAIAGYICVNRACPASFPVPPASREAET